MGVRCRKKNPSFGNTVWYQCAGLVVQSDGVIFVKDFAMHLSPMTDTCIYNVQTTILSLVCYSSEFLN